MPLNCGAGELFRVPSTARRTNWKHDTKVKSLNILDIMQKDQKTQILGEIDGKRLPIFNDTANMNLEELKEATMKSGELLPVGSRRAGGD